MWRVWIKREYVLLSNPLSPLWEILFRMFVLLSSREPCRINKLGPKYRVNLMSKKLRLCQYYAFARVKAIIYREHQALVTVTCIYILEGAGLASFKMLHLKIWAFRTLKRRRLTSIQEDWHFDNVLSTIEEFHLFLSSIKHSRKKCFWLC